MTFEEARKVIDSKYDIVGDLGDAWFFSWKEAENTVGGDQGYVVMKETGEKMLPYEYFKNTTTVRNIKSYHLASLFNAGSMISSYYRAEVNHDMPKFAGRDL